MTLSVRGKYFLSITLSLCISFFISSCNMPLGYVVTKDNKKIEGKLFMTDGYNIAYFSKTENRKLDTNSTSICIYNNTINRKKNTLIKLNDIKYVKIKLKKEKDSSRYLPYKNDLWKVLYTKGNAGIYEREWYVEEGGLNQDLNHKAGEIGIFLNGNLKWSMDDYGLSGSRDQLLFNRYLIKVANKHYHENTTIEDFKDTNMIYNYILNKENERIDSGNKPFH